MKNIVEEDVDFSPDVEINEEESLAEYFGNDSMYADPKTLKQHEIALEFFNPENNVNGIDLILKAFC